ncbi:MULTISPECIES: GNAT family N-acetyltransferase [Clostridium]|uniref:GNAT family N-acetyltransferase n=1 Tax=Clostridium cibarium TaxID=2762247 RepID=A0ABR8PYF9_9CLOT|nr:MULTISPECIES: GNAT family N-acetyltransferase [Clostridium]MBD7913186.1 GNAT family N-acetyltransferase [Clostridium cibarium]
MSIFKEIETKRLIIRRFREEDWKDIYEYLSDEKVVYYEPYEAFTVQESKEEAISRAGSEEFIAVCLKETGKVIGNFYFGKREYDTYELGYVFNSSYWHKGYATESAKAFMNFVFKELKVRRIIAMCNPENELSWKLLERLNLIREGYLRKNIYFKINANNEPIWQDTYEYGILRESYYSK